ncbi:MAG: NusG domain II-containing protein [Oscillibacter sp.]|nr:NusG domain II-containing protein [Oscillibacter sp.]
MKRMPALKANRWDGAVAVLVVVLAVVCGVLIWGRTANAGELTVVVTADGQEVERVALDAFPDTPRAYSGNGYTLQVSTETDGKRGICVSVSDCPTQDCVHTGTITRAGQSIVCLPARISITLEGETASGDGPDLVIG